MVVSRKKVLWSTAVLLSVLAAGSFQLFSLQKEPVLIPREVFFDLPEITSPQLSPDGSRIAYLAPYGKALNVWIYDRKQKIRRVLTRDQGKGIPFYIWTPDGKALLLRQDPGDKGDWHLCRIDLAGGPPVDLTPFKGVQANLLRSDPNFPDQVLITLNKEDAARQDVYRLQLSSGALALVDRNTGKISDWIVDAAMQVRGAVAIRPEGDYDVLVRENEKAAWKPQISWDLENGMASSVLGFSKNGKKLFLLDARGTDTAHLAALDLTSGVQTTVFLDPDYDVDAASLNPVDHEPEMASVTRARQVWIALNDTVQKDIETLRKIHPGDFSIVSRSKDDRLWIVLFNEDVSPLNYYLYDRNTRKAEFLFVHRPALLKYRLAAMKPVTFRARDGLKLQGYLTLPIGKKKPFPMVLLVHGGPWMRDHWRFDPVAQWLANRGYACLQVNYRGSAGFGKKFLNAGNKEWGRAMQQDLTEGVQWAVREGIADPARVGIMGASYGGYAALAGAAFTPELFRCAIDMFGPSDLATLIRAMPATWASEKVNVLKRIGDPETEAAFLKERSPLYAVDQVRIPLLIAQGVDDTQTPRSESDRMVAALHQRGIECEYLVFPDEAHGLAKPENRLQFFKAAEVFLARHLGGRAES